VPEILRLQHVAVTVPIDGVERARAFYGGVLGLREVQRPPENAARPGIWYAMGDTELHVQARDAMAAPGDRHPAFAVDDIDAWRSRFGEHNVTVIDLPTLYGRVRFNVRDPFGNLIELTTEGEAPWTVARA
jgi:catechol 2,3-dioxygenase-like lactoylglutathione lyase family enzyme